MMSVAKELNAFTHPGRLPPEVLAEVFAHLQVAGLPRDAITTVSRVCSYWRQVALGSPRLWCHIQLDFGFQHARRSIRRSKDVSLSIYGGLNNCSEDLMVAIFNQSHRIVRIEVHEAIDEDLALSLRARYQDKISVPQLSVYIENSAFNIIYCRMHGLQKVPLLPILHAPNLAVVRLAPIGEWWNTIQYQPHTLRDLMIEYPEETFNVLDLLRALRNTPVLQSLRLRFASISRGSADDMQKRPDFRDSSEVTLPNLQTIHLSNNDLITCADLLTKISSPPLAILYVSAGIYDPLPSELVGRFYGSFQAVVDRVADGNRAHPHSLHALQVRLGEYGITNVSGWTSREEPPKAPVLSLASRNDFRVDGSNGFDISAGEHIDIFGALNRISPSRHIRYLAVSVVAESGHPLPDVDCLRLFDTVETVAFRGPALRPMEHLFDGGSGVLLFPNVKHLQVLCKALWCEHYQIDNQGDFSRCDEECNPPQFDKLLAFLQQRKDLEVPFDRVTIYDYFQSSQVEPRLEEAYIQLSSIVPKVAIESNRYIYGACP